MAGPNLPVRHVPCHSGAVKSTADQSTDQSWVAGVDGCPAGWLAAFVGPAGTSPRVEVFTRFVDILADGAAIVAVDMPIGLAERTGPG